MIVREARQEDAQAITAIYNEYILHSIATFQEEPVSPEETVRRLDETASVSLPWLVAEESDRVIGYAHASKWKGRCAYRYTVESSVYLHPSATGRSLGTALYEALIADLRERKLHSIIGGIALPNDASVRLHEKLGFRKIGHFQQVGYKFGRWIDVGYWQLNLQPLSCP